MSPEPAASDRPHVALNRRMDANDREDTELVRQIREGNPNALTPLFEKYGGMVQGIARRMLKNSSEAEEVVQQVFLDTYKAIDQFDPLKASYKTWLFQYAYHRTIHRKNYLQSKGFYLNDELDEELLPTDLYKGAGRALRLATPEVVRLVHQLLESIPENQRVAIELTFIEGLTAVEISARTGETASAVRHHLYRGLSTLRAALLQGEQPQETASAKTKVEGVFVVDPARLL